MTSGRNNQRTLNEAITAIGSVIGLMGGVFALLAIFLPTNLTQPIGALLVGLIFTVILVWMGKLELSRALVTWLMVSMGLIILYLIVSRPATIVGSVIDNSSSPIKGLTLILTDANGVDHKAVTDENGVFEIKNVSEGKFTISANGELLISGRVPSGWKQIIDSQLEIGSFVYKPNPTIIATSVPTETPSVISTTLPVREQTVTIVSTQGWQNTLFQVEAGQYLEISYISGEWRADPTVAYVGPGGYNRREFLGAILKGVNDGAMIARIARIGDGESFLVGENLSMSVPQTGYLQMRINDGDVDLSNNDGEIVMKVSVR